MATEIQFGKSGIIIPKRKNEKVILAGIAALLVFIAGATVFFYQFSAPVGKAEVDQFVVSLNENESGIISRLYADGYIKHKWAFGLALSFKNARNEIKPGGYEISKNMSVWKIVKTLTGEPHMKWLVIPEGLRKEEIADMAGKIFNWQEEDKIKFINIYQTTKPEYFEGVYFPDTYLLLSDEKGDQIAMRMINRFNEKFAPYPNKFYLENIKWDTALKIASLVQREAANKEDMPIVAEVIWNRLLNDMKLEIDATLQYARGKTDNGWWTPISPGEKNNKSFYNTYLYKGLPPHPICNPGLEAIEAVLHPAQTHCFYYLHDSNKQIHCAVTYEEHLQNINKFLKQ